jgi:radical SAM/Cys-rich protein
VPTFRATLEAHGLTLTRGEAVTLQVNLGLVCNQRCAHCRLDAGPHRTELMSRATMEEVADYVSRGKFRTVDITGGAPELHPGLEGFLGLLAGRGAELRLRSNLTALHARGGRLLPILRRNSVAVAASFPSPDRETADLQRGSGTFDRSVECLRELNALGWGIEGSGLTLDLVTNPPGAALPRPQEEMERDFRRELADRWGIRFNRLFSFTNLPLGRFHEELRASGRLSGYIELMASSFSPAAVPRLMCRDTVSVDWNGFLYDCDFNIQPGLHLGESARHVSDMAGAPEEGSPISVGDHCFGCAAGTGFT